MKIVVYRLLYTDTDSIFYIQTPSNPEIPLGILLEEFKNELDDEDDYITLFWSYIICVFKGQNSLSQGFILVHDTCKHINLETMVDMITYISSTKYPCSTTESNMTIVIPLKSD